MTGKEEAATPNKLLNIAEKLHDAAGFLAKPITGSPSPSYVQLHWRGQPHINPKTLAWVEIPGNPEAGRLPRKWPTAVILGVGSTALTEVQPPNTEAQQAVAYKVEDDIVRVGVLPGNERFGYASKAEHEAIAMRIGPGTLHASMGLWLPNEQQFISPQSVEVLYPEVQIEKIDRQFPGVILV